MPDQVGGENQKPGDAIACAYLLADRAKKLCVACSAVGSEQALANQEDANRHQHKAEEKQAGKKSYFLANYRSKD